VTTQVTSFDGRCKIDNKTLPTTNAASSPWGVSWARPVTGSAKSDNVNRAAEQAGTILFFIVVSLSYLKRFPIKQSYFVREIKISQVVFNFFGDHH
jgi:hypothetical protein